MNKVKELRIDSTLWATPARLVNLLDFKPEKLSIKTESNANNDVKVHNVRYENGGFYLTINNLRGYFNFSNNLGTLTMLFDDINQELINSVDDVNFGFSDYFRDHGVIRFDTDDTLPLDAMVSIYSMTIIIRSVYRNYYDRFYPQIHLANCIYKKR